VRALASNRRDRRALWLRLTGPPNLFQPYGDTLPDRYPEVFAFVRAEIGDAPQVRLLSFGCSTGDEVASLRHYFPRARIRGIDISRGNIRECRKRDDLANVPDVDFVQAGSVEGEPPSHYDAIFCMAVLRHGGLAGRAPGSCAHLISFQAFERTVTELSECLKPGGLFVIEHSNFRFADTTVSMAFDCIRRRTRTGRETEGTPLFGSDNLVLPPQDHIGTVFRKRPSEGQWSTR
jgi:SAM-dependent methyltransferase